MDFNISNYTPYKNDFGAPSLLVGFIFLLFVPVHGTSLAQAQAPSTGFANGVIVQLESTRTIQSLGRSTSDFDDEVDNVTVTDAVDELDLKLVKDLDPDRSVAELIDEIERSPLVKSVEPNLMRTFSHVPSDSLFSNQWALRNTGQSVNGSSGTSGADIDATIAWDSETSTNAITTIAVIDTGVDYNHGDLAGNMWDGSNCRDEFNSPVSGGCPNHGWNFENDNNNPIDSGQGDSSYAGHGTFAASMIAAVSNNGAGISGSSRYNRLNVMALRFNFDVFSEIKAINFAKYNGVKVINASYGGGGYSQIESDTIAAFPGIVVAAAGNGGADFVGDNNDLSNFYPCNYNLGNIICVAASNQNDQLASFSNYGAQTVDIAAPGVNLLGIYRGDYLYGNGTSFATPLVAAAVGMAYAGAPSASVSDIRGTVLSQSDSVSALSNRVVGGRRLNLAKVLGAQIPTTPDLSEANQRYAYRFFSPLFKGHFYTVSTNERDSLITSNPNWNYEGIAFKTYQTSAAASARPVYRFYSSNYKGHFYTVSESEKSRLISSDPNWRYEGIAYYGSSSPSGNKPLYRFWSPVFRHHFYTVSVSERNNLIANDPNWAYEGIAYYLPR